MVDTVVLRHHRYLQLRLGQAMLPKGGDTKSGKIALDATLRNVGASLSDPTKGRKDVRQRVQTEAVVYQKMRREEAAKKYKPEVGALLAITFWVILTYGKNLNFNRPT